MLFFYVVFGLCARVCVCAVYVFGSRASILLVEALTVAFLVFGEVSNGSSTGKSIMLPGAGSSTRMSVWFPEASDGSLGRRLQKKRHVRICASYWS